MSRQKAIREPGRAYSIYVLLVLVLVYVCNFIDRLIISILADDIKADLGISDGQLGFIAGTAFAVFYALFGLPLGRMADIWIRKKLISIGIIAWSFMTMLSGTATNFLQLALYRCGVGIGEASASPAAFSMLADYFPRHLRATVLSIYTSGGYIGMGLGVFIGGWIVEGWGRYFSDPSAAPFELAGWQVAFFVVGFPGILLGLWVATLREPVRGLSEGIVSEPVHVRPLREAITELAAIIPPFSLIGLFINGRGMGAGIANIFALLLVIAVMSWLTVLTGDPQQWIVFGVGIYATISWVQGLALRDRPTFSMMFLCRSFCFSILGFCSISFFTYGLAVWLPSFFIRVHSMPVSEAGTVIGLSMAIGGGIGINLGGYLADYWRLRNPRGRIYFAILTVLATLPVGWIMLNTSDKDIAVALNLVLATLTAMWVGPATSTITDLVLPRMRAVAAAFYFLVNVFLGLALGPYLIGWFSDYFMAQGSTAAESLRVSLSASLLSYCVPLLFLILACFRLEHDEAHRLARAKAAGEGVPDH